MTLRITVDIFSGRPNPTVELDGKKARDFLQRAKPAKALKRGAMPSPEYRLGYRGLIVEQIRAPIRALPRTFRIAAGAVYGPELAHTIADPELEEFFAGPQGPAAKIKVLPDFSRFLTRQLRQLKEFDEDFERHREHWPHRPRCLCAPLYEPAWWNDGGQKQWHNNCYNYASNYRTDTFRLTPGGGQPGAASGAMYTALTCAAVGPAAISDGLIANPAAHNRCPKEGHLVALVIAPGIDFHWYRKGRNGLWTHKPGSTPVTNIDNSGHLIPDPRTANRGMYTNFCTFMTVMHGHIKIA